MKLTLFRCLVPALFLASPPVFAVSQNCAAMEADGPQWFAAQLDQVQATFQSGNSTDAYGELWQAMMSLPRRADVSLDARCVGPALWQRLYDLRRKITQTLGKQAENSGQLANTNGALDRYITGDNRADAQRVIPKLTPTAAGTTWVINRLRAAIDSLDYVLESGFDLLPEEQSAREFWQSQLDATIVYTREQGADFLKQESGELSRESTAQEKLIEQGMEDQQAMVAGLFADESLTVSNEARRDVLRADASLKKLKAARDWLQAISHEDAAPARERAVARGDALMARASETSLSLEARDSLYEAAGDYFEFAEDRKQQQVAEQGRAAIEPALQAERDQRSARLDKKADQLQQSAEEFKQSMEKTEAQKESFKQEADAMEGELGF